MSTTPDSDIHTLVRSRYGATAKAVAAGQTSSCCGGGSCCSSDTKDPITSDLYEAAEVQGIPATAVLASLGCGNPTALAELRAGETVLDLGSGGGIDVLLSAQRVGPTGHVYGLDMTDEMLDLARRNAEAAGVGNVTFLKGQIEQIPLPDNSVDVIISNCVINLAVDKPQVIREAFRVLRPGGRFAVSDVVVRGDVPADVRRSMELWVGCIAGALEEREFVSLLDAAGFVSPSVEPTRIYRAEDARAFLQASGLDADRVADDIDGTFCSAFVRAIKPGTAA
ncbi:MAG: arsenite methyltransferase [Gemmatimonadaceae bacterium]|nr:arsenite methyltransferase [Gemmatimonadaceae bacterium]MCW5825279.1 arsenite methyltransferase [Gemmatimonadaceae bacterium]